MHTRSHAVVLVAAALALLPASAPALTFHLLCWTNDTPALPSAAGRRPAPDAALSNDWLVFTQDDDVVGATFNPYGAFSHSFEDIAGQGGALADAMPSLSGSFEVVLSPLTPDLSTVHVTRVDFGAQIEPSHRGHIQLAHEDDTVLITNPLYHLDGQPNAGTWQPESWAVQFTVDLFAEHMHDDTRAVRRDEHEHEVAHAHSNQWYLGYLIPLQDLTNGAPQIASMDDPAGFYVGDFAAYLTNQALPRVPLDAQVLLLLQSPKTRVAFSHEGMTTNSLFGMTLLAYSTDPVPEPGALALLALLAGWRYVRRIR